MHEKLKSYITIAEFIAGIMGDDTEVILFDVSDDKNQAVLIKNNHVSGRGATRKVSDYLMETANHAIKRNKKYLFNYQVFSKNGKELIASTMLIFDDDNITLIGIISINTDFSKVNEAKRILDSLIPQSKGAADSEESDILGIRVTTLDVIEEVAHSYNDNLTLLTQEEKIQIVGTLCDKGVFNVKNSISHTANVLQMSEPTIYRYIKIVRDSK